MSLGRRRRHGTESGDGTVTSQFIGVFSACRGTSWYSLSNMSTNEVMARLGAAVGALGDVDVSAWSEDTLKEQLGDLSTALVTLDALLSRVADEVRARGLRIEEPVAA